MKILFSFSLICLIACSEANLPKSNRPPNTIPQEKMIDILKEIHYAETKVTLDKKNSKTSIENIKKYYQTIFTKYNVNDSAFFESMDYYYRVPDSLTQMYNQVIKNMMLDQDKIKQELKQ